MVNEAYIPAVTVVDNVFDLVNVAFMDVPMRQELLLGKFLVPVISKKPKQNQRN